MDKITLPCPGAPACLGSVEWNALSPEEVVKSTAGIGATTERIPRADEAHPNCPVCHRDFEVLIAYANGGRKVVPTFV